MLRSKWTAERLRNIYRKTKDIGWLIIRSRIMKPVILCFMVFSALILSNCTKDYGDEKFNKVMENAKRDAHSSNGAAIFVTSDMQIEHLTPDIGKLERVYELSINNDNLISLPEAIGNLKDLDWMEIKNNKMTQLPESIGNLKKLRILILDMENLESIPDTLKNCINLEWIKIRSSRLTKIPDIFANLKNLKQILFDGENIKSISKSLQYCSNLEGFRVRSKVLDDIPDIFSNMPKLCNFEIETPIPKLLPSSISNLNTLLRVALYMENLDDIHLINFSSVKQILIYSKKIYLLPDLFWSDDLRSCALLLPNLKKLPQNVSSENMRDLYVYSNYANTLPKNIGQMNNLETLGLEMASLKNIPSEIYHLKKLTTLGIINTSLSNMPIYLSKFPNLKKVVLCNNNLSNVSSMLNGVKNLTALAVVNNRLLSIPSEVFKMEQLSHLDLSFNDISDINNLPQNMQWLEAISVSNNKISTVPSQLFSYSAISEIDLHGNNISTWQECEYSSKLKSIYIYENPTTDGSKKIMNNTSLFIWQPKTATHKVPFVVGGFHMPYGLMWASHVFYRTTIPQMFFYWGFFANDIKRDMLDRDFTGSLYSPMWEVME